MKDWPSANRDFIEVSRSYRKANHFSLMGELDIMPEGSTYMHTRIEPDGERPTFACLNPMAQWRPSTAVLKSAKRLPTGSRT